jgi:hypothetical protein
LIVETEYYPGYFPGQSEKFVLRDYHKKSPVVIGLAYNTQSEKMQKFPDFFAYFKHLYKESNVGIICFTILRL